MNRTTLLVLAALACALLVFSMLGCGQTNDLKSIQLSASNTSATPPGTLDLQGEGGTLQVYVWGNYSNGQQKLLNSVGDVAYQISITPGSAAWTGEMGDPNATPPQTVQLSTTGLMTAVTPFACTWINTAQTPPATTPAWALLGSYTVTATYAGLTTPPVYVAVASAAGIYSASNTAAACGPTTGG